MWKNSSSETTWNFTEEIEEYKEECLNTMKHFSRHPRVSKLQHEIKEGKKFIIKMGSHILTVFWHRNPHFCKNCFVYILWRIWRQKLTTIWNFWDHNAINSFVLAFIFVLVTRPSNKQMFRLRLNISYRSFLFKIAISIVVK